VDRPVLDNWLTGVMAESVQGLRENVERLGEPVFGLAGPLAASGQVSSWACWGRPHITLRFGPPDALVEVATGTLSLGGTDVLVSELLLRSARSVALPFSISVAERLVMLPVLGIRTQVRVLEASTGHWIAATGSSKRHLRLTGTPGTSPDDLELVSVVLS